VTAFFFPGNAKFNREVTPPRLFVAAGIFFVPSGALSPTLSGAFCRALCPATPSDPANPPFFVSRKSTVKIF
jgi:hypothetical protein